MANPEVHNRIRELRLLNGQMTQQELADKVGIARQTVVALEQGKYYPSLLLAFQIARCFGENVESVFRFEPGQ